MAQDSRREASGSAVTLPLGLEYGPVVRAVLARILGQSPSHPDVEDGAQEVFRRVLEARTRPDGPLRPWLIGIARHVALDVLRGRKRALRHDPLEGLSGEGALSDQLFDPAPDPSQRAEIVEQERLFAEAFRALPVPQQLAISMFHADGLTYEEIAANLGVPLGTVATWIMRARTQLASRVTGKGRIR